MVIDCEHCGTRLIALHCHPTTEQRNQAIAVYSRRCFCHMTSETLRGLLKAEPNAVAIWQAHLCHWYQTDGSHSAESAQDVAYRTFALTTRQREQIKHILNQRETTRRKELANV